MITVTRKPAGPIYCYTLYADGVRVTARHSSHRFPLALVTPDGKHMVLIPQSQARRADKSRLLVTVAEA